MKKVIYILPDYEDDFSIDEFERETDDVKLHIAKNCNYMYVFSLEEFQQKFNNGLISDGGYIFIV